MHFSPLKHNPISFYILDKWLDFQCHNVRGYIFVATTGRSGSSSLTRIFTALENAVCFHEPHPIMTNDVPPGMDSTTYFKKLFWLKKIYVKRAARQHDYYIETNHQFIKNFCDMAVTEFGNRLKVIHLVRTPQESALSFYQIDSIPGKTARGKSYLLDPSSDSNILDLRDLLFGDGEFSHDFYKCLWYWYETEARVQRFTKSHPHVPVFRLDTEGLNNSDTLARMFSCLNIVFNMDRLRRVTGTRDNTKSDQKSKSITPDEVNSMHNHLFQLLEQRYGNIISELGCTS